MTQKLELKEVVTEVLRRVIGQINSQLSHQGIDPCPSSWTEVKIWTFHLLAPSTAFQLIKTVHAMLAAKIIVENFPYYCYHYCTWTLPQLLTKVAEITESHPVRSIYQITWLKAFDFPQRLYKICCRDDDRYWLTLLGMMTKMMVNMIWSSISNVLCPRSLWVKEYHNFIKVSCQDHTSIDQYFNSCQISLFRKQSTHILSNTRTHQQQQTNKQI